MQKQPRARKMFYIQFLEIQVFRSKREGTKPISSRGDGVTSAFSKLRPIWISHLYYFFPKMGKLK